MTEPTVNHERHPERDSKQSPVGAPGIGGWRLWVFLMTIFFVASWAFRYMADTASPARRLAYSEFRQHVADGRIRSVRMEDQRISGEMSRGDEAGEAAGSTPPTTETFETLLPPTGDDMLRIQRRTGAGADRRH